MTHIYKNNMLKKSMFIMLGFFMTFAVLFTAVQEATAQDAPSNLFFSEYIEGSGNNKALEIFNNTDSTVTLANYQIAQTNNGSTWIYFHEFAEGATIAAGGVYVLIADQVDPLLFNHGKANEVLPYPSPIHYNGDDARAIIHIDPQTNDTTWIDMFGEPDLDPGTGWSVAGVANATVDHTLIRKSTVTQGNTTPLGSFGTDADDSEWIVKDINDFSNLGYWGKSPALVTFIVNTATLADTAMPNHVLQMRGSGIGSASTFPAITWGDDTGLVGTNIGGDYWEFNFELMPGDSLEYKFWVGTDANTAFGNGWENLSNRKFGIAADASGEITAPIHYFNRTESPFEEKTDSVGVLFRVNVGAQVQLGNFDPAEHTVSVRGGYAPLSWDDGTVVLDKETGTSGDNAIYSKIVYFHGDSLVSHTPFNYKFYLNNGKGDGGYETTSDRPFNITTAADTTLHIVNFNNKAPIQGTVLETNLNFEVNVGILEGLGFFNATIDTVFIKGDWNGWGNDDRMTYNSFTGTFSKSGIPYTSTVGADVNYKYYIKWDNRRDEEGNEFYLSGVSADGSGWEEPGVTGGGNRKFQLIDDANQPVRSEFYNGIEPQALLTESNVDGGAISITFSIDMNPAMGIETSPFKPATDSVFLFVDTPFFALTNGITVPGDDGGKFGTITDEERERLRFTDTEGDGIYKLTLDLTLPTLNSIGFRIAYGEPTSETGNIVINGEGTEPGRRHYQYIQPQIDAEGNVTWPSTFTFPQLTWQAENLPFEAPPSYTSGGVSVEKLDDVASFSLDQNYPNPFNPTTNIRFNLANAANVTLSVYNVLGQKVASLVNNTRFNSGSHIVAFDARNLASGVYLYRIEAGNFVSQKRMTLIK